jgi:hypothetical protein
VSIIDLTRDVEDEESSAPIQPRISGNKAPATVPEKGSTSKTGRDRSGKGKLPEIVNTDIARDSEVQGSTVPAQPK